MEKDELIKSLLPKIEKDDLIKFLLTKAFNIAPSLPDISQSDYEGLRDDRYDLFTQDDIPKVLKEFGKAVAGASKKGTPVPKLDEFITNFKMSDGQTVTVYKLPPCKGYNIIPK